MSIKPRMTEKRKSSAIGTLIIAGFFLFIVVKLVSCFGCSDSTNYGEPKTSVPLQPSANYAKPLVRSLENFQVKFNGVYGTCGYQTMSRIYIDEGQTQNTFSHSISGIGKLTGILNKEDSSITQINVVFEKNAISENREMVECLATSTIATIDPVINPDRALDLLNSMGLKSLKNNTNTDTIINTVKYSFKYHGGVLTLDATPAK